MRRGGPRFGASQACSEEVLRSSSAGETAERSIIFAEPEACSEEVLRLSSAGETAERSIIFAEPVSRNPTAKQTRIYVCVCGDLWHYGHANLCASARREYGGENPWLIVGVCSDKDVTGYKRAPIMSALERAKNASCCRFVDEVVVNCPFVLTESFMNEMQIDFVVHGDDHSEASAKKYYSVALDRDAYRTVPYTDGISTSEIISRIEQRKNASARKNAHGH